MYFRSCSQALVLHTGIVGPLLDISHNLEIVDHISFLLVYMSCMNAFEKSEVHFVCGSSNIDVVFLSLLSQTPLNRTCT